MSRDKVYIALKREFKALRYEPGAPIVIGQVSESLSVSHIPVREALARLAEEGHVEHLAGRGFFARRVDPQAVLEGYSCLEVTLLQSLEQIMKVPEAGQRAAALIRDLADRLEENSEPESTARTIERLLTAVLEWLDKLVQFDFGSMATSVPEEWSIDPSCPVCGHLSAP